MINYLLPGNLVRAWKYENLTFMHSFRKLGPYKKAGLRISLYGPNNTFSKQQLYRRRSSKNEKEVMSIRNDLAYLRSVILTV